MTLTTISGNNATRQLSIDSSATTLVLHTPVSKRSSEEYITIADRIHGGSRGGYDAADWGLDIKTVIGNLTNAGCNLHALPYVFGGEFVGTAYANPNAFQCVITSEPYTKPGETEPSLGVILDIEGYGRLETEMPVATLDIFLADVAKIKTNLMKITPDQAHARFYKPGYSLFDADQVESIRPNGIACVDVNLFGAAMMGPARIDFNVNCGSDYGNLKSDIATRMAKKWHGVLNKDVNDQAAFHELSWRAQQYADKVTTKMTETFSAAVAAKAPGLVKVPYAKTQNYVNPARVAWAYAVEERVGFTFIKPAYHTYPNEVLVDFASKDDAVSALNEVQNTPARKPVP